MLVRESMPPWRCRLEQADAGLTVSPAFRYMVNPGTRSMRIKKFRNTVDRSGTRWTSGSPATGQTLLHEAPLLPTVKSTI